MALRQRETGETLFLSDEGPMLETLDYTIRIGSIPTFLYFDLYAIYMYIAIALAVILEMQHLQFSSEFNYML